MTCKVSLGGLGGSDRYRRLLRELEGLLEDIEAPRCREFQEEPEIEGLGPSWEDLTPVEEG